MITPDMRPPAAARATGHEHKQQRQRAIRELIVARPVGSQREVVDALVARASR
jgi:hypothetical protein